MTAVQKLKLTLPLLLFGSVLFASVVHAHRLAPSLLQVEEQDTEGYYKVIWQEPTAAVTGQQRAVPRLPAHCEAIGERALEPTLTETGPALRQAWTVNCGSKGLFGSEIEVTNLAGGGVALLRMQFRNDVNITRILNEDQSVYTVPRNQGFWATSLEYIQLGYIHILEGVDHLLFVLGLLLLVTGVRRLVAVITMFTIGHSITLSLAVLGYIAFGATLLEFLILLSILWVFIELTRPPHKRGIMGRKPATGAALFGLIHGMGFAAVLREAGLPVRDIPAALMSFNIGVELGQLTFVLATVLLRYFLPQAFRAFFYPWLILLGGSLSVYWMISILSEVF